MFQRAQRQKTKLKMALEGPAGSGKTFSALRIAKGLGSKIALIDTEKGASNYYANLFEFDNLELTSHLPDDYIKALKSAADAGYDTVIIDSISHEWIALLDWVEKRKTSMKSQFAVWAEATPMHNRFIEAILQSNLHIIATMRTKSDWILEDQDGKKGKPKKVGLAAVQREGMDFEFRLVFHLEQDHNAFVQKDNTNLFSQHAGPLTEEVGKRLRDWLDIGSANLEGQSINNTQKPTASSAPVLEIEIPNPFETLMPTLQDSVLLQIESELKHSSLRKSDLIVRFKKNPQQWTVEQCKEALEEIRKNPKG